MKMFRKDEGFTLVELMVVVLIIGILVAIAIPVFNAAKGNAQKRACHANQRTLEGAAQTWLAEDPAHAVADVEVATLVSENYIKETPVCPGAAETYEFNDTDATLVTANFTTHGHY